MQYLGKKILNSNPKSIINDNIDSKINTIYSEQSEFELNLSKNKIETNESIIKIHQNNSGDLNLNENIENKQILSDKNFSSILNDLNFLKKKEKEINKNNKSIKENFRNEEVKENNSNETYDNFTNVSNKIKFYDYKNDFNFDNSENSLTNHQESDEDLSHKFNSEKISSNNNKLFPEKIFTKDEKTKFIKNLNEKTFSNPNSNKNVDNLAQNYQSHKTDIIKNNPININYNQINKNFYTNKNIFDDKIYEDKKNKIQNFFMGTKYNPVKSIDQSTTVSTQYSKEKNNINIGENSMDNSIKNNDFPYIKKVDIFNKCKNQKRVYFENIFDLNFNSNQNDNIKELKKLSNKIPNNKIENIKSEKIDKNTNLEKDFKKTANNNKEGSQSSEIYKNLFATAKYFDLDG